MRHCPSWVFLLPVLSALEEWITPGTSLVGLAQCCHQESFCGQSLRLWGRESGSSAGSRTSWRQCLDPGPLVSTSLELGDQSLALLRLHSEEGPARKQCAQECKQVPGNSISPAWPSIWWRRDGVWGGENRRKNKSWIAERIEGKREKERSKYHHHPLCFHLAFGTCWHLSTTSFWLGKRRNGPTKGKKWVSYTIQIPPWSSQLVMLPRGEGHLGKEMRTRTSVKIYFGATIVVP